MLISDHATWQLANYITM